MEEGFRQFRMVRLKLILQFLLLRQLIHLGMQKVPADNQHAELLVMQKPIICMLTKVIVVTDNLVDLPCFPMEIEGNYVDYVVVVDKIGIPEKIVSGTTQITKSPDRLLIAELTASFLEKSGILKDGVTMQAGAGGTSLAIAVFVHQILKKKGWKSKFGFGGSTKYMVRCWKKVRWDIFLMHRYLILIL